MDQKCQFCSFFLDDILFGIPVQNVQEIVGAVTMTPVPLAPRTIKGLINLRGQIVTAIDLRTCLRLSGGRDRNACVGVIIHVADGYASLLVDRVGEIVEVDEEAFEPPPETLRGVARELIRGAYKLNGRLLLVLDPVRVVNALDGGSDEHARGSVAATARP